MLSTHHTRALYAVIVVLVVAAGASSGSEPEAALHLPVGERLNYGVTWMGIHSGELEINSFSEQGPDGRAMERIVILMRSSNFFDGIYRVRSRMDSYYDPVRRSSVKYREQSQEKKRRKDELWEVDLGTSTVIRHEEDGDETIAMNGDRVLDPLAFIFSLRTIPTEVGGSQVFNLMTSKGDFETLARVTRTKTLKTKAGRCSAVAVVPEPRDKMMFSKSGAMVVWIDREAPHRLCRIEFDLSFGKLVARLRSVAPAVGADEIEDWETWGD